MEAMVGHASFSEMSQNDQQNMDNEGWDFDSGMEKHEHEVDHHCDFCPPASTASQGSASSQLSLQVENKFYFDLVIPSTSPESPYRPPISA